MSFVYLSEKAEPNQYGQIQAEERISDENTCDILAMTIGAGAETTSSTLQTFFKVMALHPEAVQRAQNGSKAVLSPPIQLLTRSRARWCSRNFPFAGLGG